MRLTKQIYKKILTNPGQLPTSYSFNKGLNSGEIGIFNGYRNAMIIITYFFTAIEALSSKAVFTIKNEEIHIKLFYYRPKGALNNNSINNLGELLSNVLNRGVKLELVKLYYPHLNSHILAKYLRLNTKRYSFNRLKKMLLKKRPLINSTHLPLKYKLPTAIVGMKIEISGRLQTERSKPRQTVSMAQLGSINSDNKTFLVDFGSYTSKNAKGAFTVKVSIGQQVSPFSSFNITIIKKRKNFK